MASMQLSTDTYIYADGLSADGAVSVKRYRGDTKAVSVLSINNQQSPGRSYAVSLLSITDEVIVAGITQVSHQVV